MKHMLCFLLALLCAQTPIFTQTSTSTGYSMPASFYPDASHIFGTLWEVVPDSFYTFVSDDASLTVTLTRLAGSEYTYSMWLDFGGTGDSYVTNVSKTPSRGSDRDFRKVDYSGVPGANDWSEKGLGRLLLGAIIDAPRVLVGDPDYLNGDNPCGRK